jgi:hypothetical protein
MSCQVIFIALVVRNGVAAKADGMIPATGKGLIVLGNMSDETVDVTIEGKTISLNPGAGAASPKDAMKVPCEPGTCKIEFKSKKSGKSVRKTTEVAPGTSWGALYDTDFQNVIRLF